LVLFEYFHCSGWAANPDDVPEIPKQNIQSEKYLISIISGSTRIKSMCHVPKGMKYNTTFFVESVVPDLVEHDCQESRRKTLRGIIVHLDNAQSHNSRKSEAAFTATKARRIPTPAYSPDLSPSDFFFEMLNGRMSGTSYTSPDELIASVPKDQLVNVYKNWTKRLNWAIKHRGSTTASEQNCILLTAILTEIARLTNFLTLRHLHGKLLIGIASESLLQLFMEKGMSLFDLRKKLTASQSVKVQSHHCGEREKMDVHFPVLGTRSWIKVQRGIVPYLYR
jgi:transposase